MANDQYNVEEWRAIQEAPTYEVSNLGRVRRVLDARLQCPGRVLRHKINMGGYPEVTIYRDGRMLYRTVHRLVCIAFHGQPPTPWHEVAHGDGIRTNACASNLRWATKSENYDDRNRHGTHNKGERNGAAKLTSHQVAAIRVSPMPSRATAAAFGISKSMVNNIRSGTSW
jgi:hypothetical protein